MKKIAIAGALLVAALLAVPSMASAGAYVSFGWSAPGFGYGCGRPSYWGGPVWAGAYRPYVYPYAGYYYAPRPYVGAWFGPYGPRPYRGGYYRGGRYYGGGGGGHYGGSHGHRRGGRH